jgi:hypothetical protein
MLGNNLREVLTSYIEVASGQNWYNIIYICKGSATVIPKISSVTMATIVNAFAVPVAIIETNGSIRSFFYKAMQGPH